MAPKSRTKGNPKRTKSDHQKQQLIVPPAFPSNSQFPPGFVSYRDNHSDSHFPPGFVPYGYVPLPQQQWQGNAGVSVYPQLLSTNNPYAPQAWNGHYAPPPVIVGPPLGMSMPPVIIAPSRASTPSPTMSPVIPDMGAPPFVGPPLGMSMPPVILSRASTPSPTMSPVISDMKAPPVPKKRVINPPSKEYLATKLVDNPLGLTNMIPQEELESKEAKHMPRTLVLKENKHTPPAIIPPHSASSAVGATPTGPLRRKARKSQPVDPPSTSYELGREDEPELTPYANQMAQLPPQTSERGTAPWILASRKLHAPKKPMDVQFMARMADLRQQTDGTSSISSTPQARESMALLGSPVSIASSAFSQSFSITSPPPAVEFPPTPVFTDRIPDGFMRNESLFVAQTPKASLRKPHPLQNLHPVTATRSFDTIREGPSSSTTPSSSNSTPKRQPNKLPASASSIRRGYWNRRGDHLTPEGYLVFPPPSMQYPDDLRTYPFKDEGYRDHSGLFTEFVRRPELPQSLPRHGNPPERPYESFVVYV